MKYMLMPLNELESSVGNCCGISYAMLHKDRWVDIQAAEDCLQTYDRFSTFVIVDNVVYQVAKDYIVVKDNMRVYIGKASSSRADIINTETPQPDPDPIPDPGPTPEEPDPSPNTYTKPEPGCALYTLADFASENGSSEVVVSGAELDTVDTENLGSISGYKFDESTIGAKISGFPVWESTVDGNAVDLPCMRIEGLFIANTDGATYTIKIGDTVVVEATSLPITGVGVQEFEIPTEVRNNEVLTSMEIAVNGGTVVVSSIKQISGE